MSEPVHVPELHWSDGVMESGFASPQAAQLLSWPARVSRILEFEAALARVQARAGLIEAAEAETVVAACRLEHLDLVELATEAAQAPTLVIPLLAQLRSALPADAAAVLHLGATSQDAVDTAAMLQVAAVLELLDEQLGAIAERLTELARDHATTVVPGRTLGQQAVPVTVGLKAARWLDALTRRTQVLRQQRWGTLAVQLGGAAGTLSVLGSAGPDVMDALAAELDLAAPALAWHTERDRISDLAGALAALIGVVDKIAADLVAGSATEVAEFSEASATGPGSSAMPHKRNPVDATAVRAACRVSWGHLQVLLVPGGYDLERAAGAWQAEWTALPAALVTATGAVERLRRSLQGLEVDPERGRRNLAVGLGLTQSEALTVVLRRELGAEASALVAELAAIAVSRGEQLGRVAADDHRVTEVLDAAALDAALDPAGTLEAVGPLIDRAIRAARERVHPT